MSAKSEKTEASQSPKEEKKYLPPPAGQASQEWQSVTSQGVMKKYYFELDDGTAFIWDPHTQRFMAADGVTPFEGRVVMNEYDNQILMVVPEDYELGEGDKYLDHRAFEWDE